MNETITSQLAHKTIRKYTGEPVPAHILDKILDVAMRTASSRGLQQASIIRVTDPDKLKRMSELGEQAYVADATEYLLFIADAHRSAAILKERELGIDGVASMEVFTEALTDACLMAQNVVVAAESVGLGTNYFGNVLNQPREVITLFDLPLLTFPVLGLGMGWPAEQPELKPRIDKSIRVMENGYVDQESFHDALKEYDDVHETFVDLRFPGQTIPRFTDETVRRLRDIRPARAAILDDIRAQGFAC